MKKPLKIVLVVAFAILVVMLLHQQRTRTSQRALAELLPQITAITLYDIHDGAADPNALASAASAPFPVEAFHRACASATSEGGSVVWKGSSLAVLTLSDGTQRQARFSYYGGFFTIDGFSGHFVVPDGGNSEFQRLHHQLIQEQFVPSRQERNKTATPKGTVANPRSAELWNVTETVAAFSERCVYAASMPTNPITLKRAKARAPLAATCFLTETIPRSGNKPVANAGANGYTP